MYVWYKFYTKSHFSRDFVSIQVSQVGRVVANFYKDEDTDKEN